MTQEDGNPSPTAMKMWPLVVGAIVGCGVGALAGFNSSFEDEYLAQIGSIAGAIIGIGAAAMLLDLWHPQQGNERLRSNFERVGSWMVRIALAVALCLFISDQIKKEVAEAKVRATKNKPK